jgi:hypothetical protein
MNCPNCGLRTLPEQKFCRACGSTLQVITQPLVLHAKASHPVRTHAIILQEETPRANNWMLWGFIIMFIGVALGVIGKMALHEEMVTVFGVLLSIAGMFLTVYPSLSPTPRRRQNSVAAIVPEVQTSPPPAQSLPPERNPDYVSSITERTTDLLKSPAATGPRQNAGGESEA